MSLIDSIFTETPNSTLYHYTSISGLIGIVNTKCLWASHIYYLNDAAEITAASEIMRNITISRLENANNIEKKFLQEFSEWINTFKQSEYCIFVFSLSTEGNLLSQWRSYTPHGKGISIGFEPHTLIKKITLADFKIAKCSYTIKDHNDLMNKLLDKLLIEFYQKQNSLDHYATHPSQKYYSFFENFRGDFLQIFSTIKNPAFEEEQEWRIISKYFPNYTVPEIKFREGASMLVPYIELNINPNADGNQLFCQVYLGPTQHTNQSHSALQQYLSNTKSCKRVSSSGIPYREW